MTATPRSSRFLRGSHAALAAAVLGLDLWTKQLAETILPMHGGTVRIVDGILHFGLVHNTGAAFGLFSRHDPTMTARALNLVALVALGIVALTSLRSPASRGKLQYGLALVFGGALGNLVDRITLGHVIDFVEVHIGRFHWPNFNVADSAICVGVALLVLDSFAAADAEGSDPRPAPEP